MTERILILNLGKKDSGIETRRPHNKRLIGLGQHIFQRFLCGLVRLRKMVQTVECSGNHNSKLKFLAETVEQCCVVIASQEKQKLLLIEKRMACIKQVSQLCFEGVLTKVQIPVQSGRKVFQTCRRCLPGTRRQMDRGQDRTVLLKRRNRERPRMDRCGLVQDRLTGNIRMPRGCQDRIFPQGMI